MQVTWRCFCFSYFLSWQVSGCPLLALFFPPWLGKGVGNSEMRHRVSPVWGNQRWQEVQLSLSPAPSFYRWRDRGLENFCLRLYSLLVEEPEKRLSYSNSLTGILLYLILFNETHSAIFWESNYIILALQISKYVALTKYLFTPYLVFPTVKWGWSCLMWPFVNKLTH